MIIHSDEPLRDPSQDVLGYNSFAYQLAKTISHMSSEGTVLSIHGPWGSGKTSVLNLVQHHLKQEQDSQVIVVSFNPWWFSGQEDLTIRFFAALKAALNQADAGDLANLLLDFADLVSEVDVPWYVKIGYRLISQFKKKCIEKYALIDQKRKTLENALRKQKKKILIIIDDIDRLTKDEISQIFKLVKSVANFPNVIYLLAFDESVVAHALKEQFFSGKDYLKKIIQVPFELPQPEKNELISFLCKRLDQLLSDLPQEHFDQQRWHTILLRGIQYYIKTPRDVIRLMNTLNVTYQCVCNEVNPVDFIALETLRVFCPDSYHLVRTNLTLLTGGGDDKSSKQWIESLLEGKNTEEQAALTAILEELFPKLHRSIKFDPGWQMCWRKNLQICSPDCFTTYFRLAVPIGSISHTEMEHALSIAKDSGAFVTLLLRLNEEEGVNGRTRLHGFLNRFTDFSQEALRQEYIPNVIKSFFCIGDQLLSIKDRQKSFWDAPDNVFYVWDIISKLLYRMPVENRIKIITDSIDCSDSVSLVFFILGKLQLEHTEDVVSKDRPEPLIPKHEELISLFQMAAKKTKKLAQSPQFLSTPYLPMVLKSWKEHGENPSVINEWLTGALTKDEDLIQFLRYFMLPEFHIDPFSGFHQTRYTLNLDKLDPFLNSDQIIDRIRSIKSKNSDSQDVLSTINCFIHSYEERLKC